jgi:hypothetical protein
MLDLAYYAVLILNLLWFSAGFHYFSIRRVAAAKVLVPPSSRDSPLFLTIAASMRLVGWPWAMSANALAFCSFSPSHMAASFISTFLSRVVVAAKAKLCGTYTRGR